MSHEPKRRHSRQRKGKRRASISLQLAQSIACPQCGTQHVSHIICPHCGYYKGEEVLSKKVKSTATA